ncbi:MAG: ABC transporter ATP-binding protein [Anaerolineae bacterium]|nr:ABC transporter ATP-binding protein [Anaerolineae bacterium]
MAAEWIIETKDLTRVYGDGVEIRALDGVSIRVAPGEFIAVMGPSGSGKSTLLNMLGALDLPTSGEVFVNGKNIRDIRNKDDFRAHTVGFVFQLHNLIPTLTAHENIEVPMVGHLPHSQRHERARELLTLVGLGDRLNHLPNQLSGGQRQRVAVARALANKPPLILADEPTGSLDTSSGQELMHLLREINQTLGTTFIVVTHDPAVARQTNRVLVMQDGRVAREDVIGSPFEEDLKMWRHSALGKSLVEGNTSPFGGSAMSGEDLKALTRFLQQANGE